MTKVYSNVTFRTYSLISRWGPDPSVTGVPLTVKFPIVTPSIDCASLRPLIQLGVARVPV